MTAPAPVRSLDVERFEKTQDLAAMKGRDLADLTDPEFEEGKRRLKTVQRRMQEILETALIENAHFGNPTDSNGRQAFKKPILFKAGAEELRRLLRLTLRRMAPDDVIAEADYVAVTVELGIFDGSGRLLATRRASCTTKEKRFKKFDSSGGWTYEDAREKLHDCTAMAEKRAGNLLTCEVSGATAFFAVTHNDFRVRLVNLTTGLTEVWVNQAGTTGFSGDGGAACPTPATNTTATAGSFNRRTWPTQTTCRPRP